MYALLKASHQPIINQFDRERPTPRALSEPFVLSQFRALCDQVFFSPISIKFLAD
jgi:hypothetical protein